MSMILDALKRSREAEPAAGSVPSVDTEHYIPSGTMPRALWRRPLPAVILILTVITIALAVGWQSDTGEVPANEAVPVKPKAFVPTQPLSAAAAAAGQTSSVSAPPPAPMQTSPEAQAPTDAGASTGVAVAALYDESRNGGPGAQVGEIEAGDTTSGADFGDSPAISPKPKQSVAVEPPDGNLAGSENSGRDSGALAAGEGSDRSQDDDVAGSQADAEEQPLDMAELLERAQRELGQSTLEPHPAPLLEDLSQQKKNAIPSIIYLQHDWSGMGSTSSVVLNGTTLSEGQRAGAIAVQEILSDSVILKWRDTEFRLRALNSWVNL